MLLSYSNWKKLNESTSNIVSTVQVNCGKVLSKPDLAHLVPKAFEILKASYPSAKLENSKIIIPNETFADFDGNYHDLVIDVLKSAAKGFGRTLTTINQTIVYPNILIDYLKKVSPQVISKSNSQITCVLPENLSNYQEDQVLEVISNIVYHNHNQYILDDVAADIESILIAKSVGGPFYSEDAIDDYFRKLMDMAQLKDSCEKILTASLIKTDVDKSTYESTLAAQVNDFKKDYANISDEEFKELAPRLVKFLKSLNMTTKLKDKEIRTIAESQLSEMLDYLEQYPDIMDKLLALTE